MRGFGAGYHLYTDDTQLHPDHPKDAAEVLSRCLEAIRIWMGSNKLKLNPSKTEWLWFLAVRFSQITPTLAIGGETLGPVETLGNLGVLLDSRLSMEDHVAAVARGHFIRLSLGAE